MFAWMKRIVRGDVRDRRRKARLRWMMSCSFEGPGQIVRGHIVDVSPGGAQIVAEESPVVGSGLRLRVFAPSGGAVEVDADVRWADGHPSERKRFGVSFDSPELFQELVMAPLGRDLVTAAY